MKKFQYKKSDSKTVTMLKVPNTEEGRAFLESLKFYSTVGTRIAARPRGPRAKHATAAGKRPRSFDQDLPRKLAESFGMYIWKPAVEQKEYQYRSKLYDEMGDLRSQIAKLIDQRDQLLLGVQQVERPGRKFRRELEN
ncbi:MAG: hypothetical protein ACRDQZ_11815 [Mycobacteriales bacterium]